VGAALGRGTAQAAHLLAPVARGAASAFTQWVVAISWGKFFVLSVLLLIFSSVAFSLFFTRGHASKHVEHGEITVGVHVVPLPDGDLRIDSAPVDDDKTVVIHPERASDEHRPRHLHKSGGSADDDVILQIDGDDKDNPQVRIDRQGVRILADDENGKASVVIDHNGVRIEKLARPMAGKGDDDAAAKGDDKAAAKGRDKGEDKGEVKGEEKGRGAATPADKALAEKARKAAALAGLGSAAIGPARPEEVAAAVEAARDQIETILQEQVDDKLEAVHENDAVERENWLATIAFLVIIVSVILKVVLGSKTKAESQARQASETAAQEGLKRQLAEAQLKMMQAQVEPHFLFNTLASVDHLIETDPSRASRMQKNLIQYLRAALPQMRAGTSSLGSEIQQCRSYLEILKVRMDERLQFSINVPQGLQSAVFPPMMLLTLVENAIKHGLEPKPEGGTLSISAVISNGALQVAVADSGMGFGVAQRGGTGVGLANVRERLQALFGSAARLQIEANSDGGTIATIVVPYSVDPGAAAAATRDAAPSGTFAAGTAGAA
jgi:signal transduction histidine kinase